MKVKLTLNLKVGQDEGEGERLNWCVSVEHPGTPQVRTTCQYVQR